jgi:serine/threonine protein phosphatase PrpC
MKFQAAARAIRGTKDAQEDAYRIFDAKGEDAGEISASGAGVALSGGGFLLVADGIGGHYGGDVASAITADTFARTFFAGSGNARERLKTSLNAANQAIAEAQAKEPGLKDMGATLVAAYLERDIMHFVSIGDSLILRYREGELHRVNEDHSYMEIADREALGSSDPALWREVITRKGRDSITIAVLGRALEEFGHAPQIESRKVLPGDVLILASDGLETLSMVQIQNFVRVLLPQGVGAVADGLIKAVAGIGGNRSYQDNATLIVVQAEGGQSSRAIAGAEREAATVISSGPIDAGKPAATPVPVAGDAPRGGGLVSRILLGVLLGLIGGAAILFVAGRTDLLRPQVSKPLPPAQEQGLQQRPQLTPEADSPLPAQRAPKGASPNQGG